MTLHRQLGISYNAAWRMRHKLMQVMVERDAEHPLGGIVELDDAYIGGERSSGKRGAVSVVVVGDGGDASLRDAVRRPAPGQTPLGGVAWWGPLGHDGTISPSPPDRDRACVREMREIARTAAFRRGAGGSGAPGPTRGLRSMGKLYGGRKVETQRRIGRERSAKRLLRGCARAGGWPPRLRR